MLSPTRAEQALRRLGATPLLLAAMAVAGAYIVALGSRLTFLLDDWVYIAYRRELDLDVFVRPDNEHFVAGPVAVWKALLALFGIESVLPFKVFSTALFLLGAGLVFVWMRRRVGEWAALIGTIPLLFLGAAFDDLLWFASITFLGSMACGLGALVALDRQDRRGDAIACALLTTAVLFSSLWVAFAAGIAADVLLRRRQRPWRGRLFVVVAPVAVYAAWWLGWGHTAESALSVHNVATTPLYVLDSIAAAIAALLGLAIPVEGVAAPNGLDWGRPLAIALLALAIWRLVRMERVPRSLWVVLTVAFAFWILGGLDVKPGRAASASRYQYTGGAFVLMIAAGLLSGVRLNRRLIPPALVVIAAAVAPNVVFLKDASDSYLRTSHLERASLGAAEIVRNRVEPSFQLSEDITDSGYIPIEVGPYYEARDEFGSPAYTEEELAAADEYAQIPADKVMAAALGLQLAELPGRPVENCRVVDLDRSGGRLAWPIYLRGVGLSAAGPVELRLGRFSESFPVELGEVPPGAWRELAIPTDRSGEPWDLEATGTGQLTLCRLPRA